MQQHLISMRLIGKSSVDNGVAHPDGSGAMALDSVLTGPADRNARQRSQPLDVCQESFTKANDGLLTDFIGSSRAWVGKPVLLPRRLRRALVASIPVLFWLVWLAIVGKGASPCAAPIRKVTSLDDHAAALLACDARYISPLAMPTDPGFVDIQRRSRPYSDCRRSSWRFLSVRHSGADNQHLDRFDRSRDFRSCHHRDVEGRWMMRGLDALSPAHPPAALGLRESTKPSVPISGLAAPVHGAQGVQT
jgi:hypothetical protein